jgi:NADH-quinone oxidoreductase subunit J
MELVMFLITAAIALIGGVAMLTSRNAVHSALFLLLNFAAIAVLFLLLQSPFLFAIQLTIYAGAIMVLFLFVVMLLGAERVEDQPDRLAWQRILALGLAVVLLVQAVILGMRLGISAPPETTPGMAAISAPGRIGAELFTTYLLPFEITGVLLLVAIVGVVVLQQRSREAKGDEVRVLQSEVPEQQQPAPHAGTEQAEPEPVAAERE